MRAVVLREFGGPEKLLCEQVPDATPTVGEIVVKVGAVSVNRSFDIGVRTGEYSSRIALPIVLGADPSGTIVAASPEVAFPKVGDRVSIRSTIPCEICAVCRRGEPENCGSSSTIGVHRWGGYAEYVSVPANSASLVPDGLSFGDATVLARHASAAYNFIIKRGQLKAGETALIFGAAGALGSFAVQVAAMSGANVIAVAGSDERAEMAQNLGAHHVINYRRHNLATRVSELTSGLGADLVFESSSDPILWPQAFSCVAQCGRLITAGAHAGAGVNLDTRSLYRKRARIIGAAGVTTGDIDFALTAGAAGRFKVTIDRVLPLEEAASAHRLAEHQQSTGKILLNPEIT